MRVAIYARYSSDLQSDASIEDQVRLCKERAKQEGWRVVAVYSDRAISGATHLRPGYQKVLEDARKHQFDILLAEALDRLSRDQEHIASLYKQLSFSGSRLVTLAEGDVSELHVGLKGTMNALFLKDLADKIRRGQRGRMAASRSPGGLPYGYDVLRELGPDGEPERGKRRANPAQAVVIQRIFSAYSNGASPRAIASQLNAERVPAPRGGLWNASTINGNRRRRDGILWNEMYLGRLIYNRQRFVKDPDTGRRVPKPNVQKDWVVVEVPELRIIEKDLWDRVHQLKRRSATKKPQDFRRPKRLLSGLIRCGVCGGAYTIIGEERLGCSVHREKGTCKNGRTMRVSKLEDRVLSGIKERLLEPDLIAEFAREYQREFNKRQREAVARQAGAKADLKAVEAKIERIMVAIEDGADVGRFRDRLLELERNRLTLQQSLSDVAGSDRVIQIRPNLSEIYRRKVGELREALNSDADTRIQAIAILRTLIDKIVLHPGAKRGEMAVEMHGQLASIVNLARAGPPGPEVMITMVAEEGFEPPTQGL